MMGKNQTREAMGEERELRDERKTLSRVSQAGGAWLLVGTRRFGRVLDPDPNRGWDISGSGCVRVRLVCDTARRGSVSRDGLESNKVVRTTQVPTDQDPIK